MNNDNGTPIGRLASRPRSVADITRAMKAKRAVATSASPYAAPATETEKTLARIWAEMLPVEKVGIDDNFFELGGHSLLATQMASKMRTAFGRDCQLQWLFEAPTIRALGEYLDRTQDLAGERAAMPAIARADRTGALPLSFSQQRLWFLDQYQPGSAFYNIPLAVKLTGPLRADVLARVFNEVVRRHESLRTVFANDAGTPRQVVLPELALPLPQEDLSHVATAEREARAQALIHTEAAKPFDLENGPLLRTGLLKLDAQEYVLLLTLHHVIADGWSMGVLVREIATLYAAFLSGQPSPLPALPVQYADFAVWQRDRLQGEVLETQVDYWRQQLAGAPALLELPTDRPRPALPSHRGATWRFELPAVLTGRLTQLALERKVTLFMLLASAFDVLLARYTGQEDISLGTPVAGRNRTEIEGLIGFFTNTLVLRAKVLGDEPFTDLLARVRETALGAFAHQDIPFEYLVEALRPQRNQSHSPLFQVMLILQNAPRERVADGEIQFTLRPTQTQTAKFDITCSIWEGDERLSGTFEYSTDLFDETTIQRLAMHYETLLDGICTEPQARVRDLPLLTPAERQQALAGWNDTAAPYPAEQPVHRLFEAQADRTPDAVAACFGDQALTYAQLNEKANRLARHLRLLGVGPEVLVGLCVERSLEMVVGLLGILKAGGAYVPLDPSYPAGRLAYMLEDARPKVLATQSALASRLPPFPGHTVHLDLDLDADLAPAGIAPKANGPDDVAYVIYTSGSTGNPKGVQVTHRAFVNFLVSVSAQTGFQPEDALLAVTSLSFDIAGLEIFVPLLSGARLVVASCANTENPQELGQAMQAHRITVMQATPATWRLLQAHGSTYRLRAALCGGEALDPALRDYLASTHAELWNLYGPTETTVWSTLARLHEGGPITLGHPIANTQVYLLDRWGQPVPAGVAGELHIGGDGLARGYLNRPELTREKFIPDPFGNRPEARLYRTGDLARRLADGTLDYLGRIDHQVKLRGFRIELGEIEAVLQEAPEVVQAVAIVREDTAGDRRLVVYLSARAGQVIDPDALHARLKARVPEYMLPSAYVVLDAFPLTPNGKTDRKALPPPSATHAKRAGHVAPRNETEKQLAALWADLLHTEVGVHDNFFELGGQSLLAVQLMARIRSKFGQDLPLRFLFDHATVEALAARLEGGTAESASGIPVAAPADDFPATPAQTQLWYHFRIYPHSSAYNLIGSIDLPGDASIRDLHEVVNFLVARHEVLRTVFVERDGEVRQRLLPPAEAGMREHRLGQELLRDAIRAEAVVPFDLAKGPLFRALLIYHADGRRTLCWAIHHIIFDGVSLEILNRETAALFEQVRARRTLALPPVKLQFKDFAAWQVSELASERQSGGREYWASALAGDLPGINLPYDFPVNERNHSGGAAYSCALDAGEMRALQALGQGEQATLFMVLLAAWYVVMHRATAQTDLIVGTPVAGRPHADLQGTLGFFVNTIMLRTQVDPQASFSSLLREVRARVLGGIEFQDHPFDQLLQDLRIKRHPMRFPISPVFFNMWNFGVMGGPVADEHLGHREVHQEMKFDLDIYIRTTGAQQLVFDCHYRTALFKPRTIEYLFGEYRSLLRQLARAGDGPIEAFPIFEARALPKALSNNDAPTAARSARPIDHASSVAACFRDIARANPAGIAVETDRERRTYGELDAASDALARRLVQTVGPANGRVALLLSHGWNAIVGILSVLKAGKAYVPLDPRHPAERLQLIASDASVEAWITDAANTDLATTIAGRVPLLQLDTANTDASPADDTTPQATLAPEAQAYLIYTSGSTGRPKGVAQTNAAVLHYLRRHTGQLSIRSGDKYAALASYSFEAGVKGILAPLLTGATVCPFDLKGVPDLSSLGRFIVAVGVTIWHSVPSVYRQFLREEAAPSNAGTSLRLVILSGDELLSTDLEQHHASRLRNVSLVNLYGLTEASLNALWKVDPDDASPLRLGHPLGDEEVSVLKPDGTPARVYEPGEIVIDSPFVAKGYWGDPQLSEEKFQPLDAGKTRFRTGDLGRWLPDGSLQLCGRRGDQVKLNGYRIELGEIEAAALSHPAIRAASALLSTAGTGERRLVLCVESALVDTPARNAFADSLKAHLQQTLPDYMIPASIALIDRLPRTPNGKVDRVALYAVKHDAPVQQAAPRNVLEHALCTMVAQVLQLDSVGIEDNFFDLGGHSLLAMQLISRVRETYQVDIALQELFVSPTVVSLAMLIDIELNTRKVLGAPAAAADPSQNYETVKF